MCARLLACPLCSQPGFLTLDALRTGLVSVSTRPLACPVCNEVLLGIDKLTIHLFGHTINSNNANQNNVQIHHDIQTIPVQAWNVLKAHQVGEKNSFLNQEQESYTIKENEMHIDPQISQKDQNHEPDVIFLQTVRANQIYSANLIQDDNEIRNELSSRIQKEGDNFNRQEKEIVNLESAIENNSPLEQNNVNLIQSSLDLISSDSSLILDNNSNLVQNDLNSVQNNSNSIPNDSNLVANDSNLISNESSLSPSDLNLIQNNLSDNDLNLMQTNLNLISSNDIQNDSSLIKNSLDLIENNSDLIEDSSDLISGNSSLIPNNEIQNNSDLIQVDSNLSESNSIGNSWIQSDSSVILIKETGGNLEEIPVLNLTETENETRKSFQMKHNGLESLNNENGEINEDEIKITEIGNETGKKKEKDILPYLKAFRLLSSKEKTERCNICGYRCDDRKILILHKQLVHMIAEKDINVRPEDLLKNYPCHLCTKVFKMRGSLMVHMRVAHTSYNSGSLTNDAELSPNGENGYNCPICAKNFKKEQHVTQHLRTHEGKQWECDVCSKMFTTKYFLKKHKRLHSGEMPYKCNICDKTFTFQQSYHKHRLYHKDDKPHTCSTCGRSFKELSTLHNHERIHTGEKPFACETCGKCFRQRVSYLVHQRIHTGVMPYKCASCGKSFRYKVSQRTHKCQTVEAQNSAILLQRLLQISEQNDKRNEPFGVQSQQLDAKCSERNKFILSMNEEGEPVLTRESDLKEPANNANLKESGSVCDKERTNIEKLHLDVPPDLFSIMMLSDKDLPTPSTEMEHLRLSSPTLKETGNEIVENYSENPNHLEIMGLTRANNQERFEDNDSLRNIDEASLNELIYAISQE